MESLFQLMCLRLFVFDDMMPYAATQRRPLQHTMSNVTYLLQRSYASSCLDVMKMRAFVPCEVADELNNYKATITQVFLIRSRLMKLHITAKLTL